METKAQIYIPQVFRSFQGYNVVDIKEYRNEHRMEIILEKTEDHVYICNHCGCKLGNQHSRYFVRAKHLKVCNWHVTICFW